jgi:hypothetical protein
MNYRILSTSTTIPAAISDAIIEAHILASVTDIVRTYRDAAIEYVERWCNVPILAKVVQQSWPTAQARYQLKWSTTEIKPTTLTYELDGDTVTVDVNTTSINTVLAINELIADDIPSNATDIVVTYDVTPYPTPKGLYAAILILTAEYYEQRTVVESKRVLNVRQLMSPYKVRQSTTT